MTSPPVRTHVRSVPMDPATVPAALVPLAGAAEGLTLPADGPCLAAMAGILDRLAAKLTAAVGEFDAAGRWGLDGATSAASWLRHHCRLSSSDAHRLARDATRLRAMPTTSAAWHEGVLSGGQVRAVLANVTERRADLYAEHEPEV